MSSSLSFDFEHPEFFVAGAIGEPGARIFYLQASQGAQIVSLRCEKQQVVALAAELGDLLADLAPSVPDPTDRSLREPLTTTWLLGSLSFGFDPALDRIVILAVEFTDEDPAQGRFVITRGQAAAVVATTSELLSGSRARCPICSLPMDPAGHICPRSNGHHVG